MAIRADKPDTIVLIDFGRAQSYLERTPCARQTSSVSSRCLHRPSTFSDTERFAMATASIRQMQGGNPSRRDDLESMAYCLVDLVKGTLPWKDRERLEKRRQWDWDRRQSTHELHLLEKRECPLELCCAGLPPVFAEFITYTRELPYETRPDYTRWRQGFREAFRSEGFAGYRLKPGISAADVRNELAAVWRSSPFEPTAASRGWSFGAFEWCV